MKKKQKSIFYYFTLIYKSKLLLLGIFVISIVSAIFYTRRLPREYESQVKAIISGPTSTALGTLLSNAVGVKDLGGSGLSSGAMTANSKELLKSRRIALLVADKINLSKYMPFVDSKNNNLQEAAFFMNSIDIVDGSSNILILKAEAKNPELAALIANTYISVLQQFLSEYALSSATKTRMFIENRLKQIQNDLETAEEQRQYFLEQNDFVIDPETTLSADYQHYSSMISDLNQVKLEIDLLSNIKNSFKSNNIENPFAGSYLYDLDPLVKETTRLLVEKETALINAKQVYKSGNFRIISIEKDIALLRDSLSKSVNNSDIVKIISLEAKKSALRTGLAEYERKFSSAPSLSKNFKRILRNVEFREQLFLSASQEYEKAKIQELNTQESIEVIDEAIPSLSPIRPKPKIILLLTAVFSIVFGVALTVTFDYLKTEFSNIHHKE